MTIPTLHTERLDLVPPDRGCDAAYQRFYTDPVASAEYGGPLTPAATWARLAFDLGAWHLQGFGVWAVRRCADGEVLGVCGFWQGRGWPRELTWWLLPEARGRGVALEASRATVEHAHADTGFGWGEVQTYTADSNTAAQALITRLGGVCVDRCSFPDGQDRWLYRIPRPSAR